MTEEDLLAQLAGFESRLQLLEEVQRANQEGWLAYQRVATRRFERLERRLAAMRPK